MKHKTNMYYLITYFTFMALLAVVALISDHFNGENVIWQFLAFAYGLHLILAVIFKKDQYALGWIYRPGRNEYLRIVMALIGAFIIFGVLSNKIQ